MCISFTLFFSQMKSAAVPDIVSNILLRKLILNSHKARWQCNLSSTSLFPRLLQLRLLRCWTYLGPESPEQGLQLLIEEKLIIRMRVVARGGVERGWNLPPIHLYIPRLTCTPEAKPLLLWKFHYRPFSVIFPYTLATKLIQSTFILSHCFFHLISVTNKQTITN
jgi:hypothetical protein